MSEESVAPVEGQPQPSVWDNPSLGKFKSPEGTVEYDKLGQSYVELESMLGKRVPVPQADSPQEDWDKYFERVAPKSPSEYHLELPGIDDVDAEELERWKQGFHKAKLHPKQASDIMTMLTQEIVSEQTKTKQANQELKQQTEATLKQEWGANYNANKLMVESALHELGGDNLHDLLSPLLENNVDGAKFLYTIAQELRTSPVLKDQGKGNFGLMTVEEAQAAKRDIMKNPENPLYSSWHNEGSPQARQPAIQKILELNGVIANSTRS